MVAVVLSNDDQFLHPFDPKCLESRNTPRPNHEGASKTKSWTRMGTIDLISPIVNAILPPPGVIAMRIVVLVEVCLVEIRLPPLVVLVVVVVPWNEFHPNGPD